MTAKKTTPLTKLASRMASGDQHKKDQIHQELSSFIAHMAMNDHPELPIEHFEGNITHLRDQADQHIKEILNK